METSLVIIGIIIVCGIVAFVVKLFSNGSQLKQATLENYNKYANRELKIVDLEDRKPHKILLDTNSNTVVFDGEPYFKWIKSCNEMYNGWKFEDFEHELKSCVLCPLSYSEPHIVIYYVSAQTGHVTHAIFKINE